MINTLEKILIEADKNDVHIICVDAKTGHLCVARDFFTGDIVRLTFWQRLRLLFYKLR